MATKTLTVKVESSIRRTLNDAGFKLCFAIEMAGKFNVVAKTSVITSKNKIVWKEIYTLSGTLQSFQVGEPLIDGQSDEKEVKFGQVYRLPNWSSATVRKDSKIPKDSFGFTNNVMAAPLIAIKIIGASEPVPIFIDHVLPPGSLSIYRPTPRVAVWFQRDIDTSTMVILSTAAVNVVEIEEATATVIYSDSGEWKDADGIVKLKVDYFETTPGWVQE